MKKFVAACGMIFWTCSTCSFALPQRPDTAAIEERLLEWVNRERTARFLAPLKFSPDFRTLAREHSRDMASQKNLTHFSSSGKSHLDRVVDAGLYFIEIGENVAASDTFDAEFIHQGFMESSEHRDNILSPQYDTVGIGVIYSSDRQYYITQDFSQELKAVDMDEAEKIIKAEINEIRKKSALPPMSFHHKADAFARRQSQTRAAWKPDQNIARFFGETHIHLIKTPVLAIPQNVSWQISRDIYEVGAVGAWFGRLEDYPGGTYLITVFLFPANPYEGMNEEDFQKMTLNAMNTKRKENGLSDIKLDKRQSRYASDISKHLKTQRRSPYVMSGRPTIRQVVSYVTENPRVWPDNLDPIIMNPGLRRIGIGITSQKSADTQNRTFWVTLIY